MNAALLVVDGDSFAHRAYHALPSSIRRRDGGPGNTLVGFTTMLLRLWQAERPRAVVVGWDTIGAPTYRNELLPSYQSGRVFDDDILEQLDLLPPLVSATGIVCGKHAGFEADDFLGAAVDQEDQRGGRSLVATSDRDAFQLASPRTTILQPTKGVSELRRVGPAEVRERYGVEPSQVPDFIALRGDPSDRIPGARGVGEKTAAALLGNTDRSTRSLRPAGSKPRRTPCGRTGTSRRSTARRPCPSSRIASRTGRREPRRPTSSVSGCWPAGSRRPTSSL